MARSKLGGGRKRREETVRNHAALASPMIAEVITTSKLNRTDSQASVVPINLEDEIRQRAYELSQQRGFEAGHETEDWLQAENEVLERYRQ